jgi:hypothetical protein
VLPAVFLDDDGISALLLEQVGKNQSCGACTYNADLRSHLAPEEELQIEKNGFVRALQDYIPLSQFLTTVYRLGHQRLAPLRFHPTQHKVAFV